MKSHSKNPEYCNYSFDDLYEAAYGKRLERYKKEKLQQLPQEKINSIVKDWSQKAHWKTEEKRGTDKKIYISFYP